MEYMVVIDIAPLIVEGTEEQILDAVRQYVSENGIHVSAMGSSDDDDCDEDETYHGITWFPYRELSNGPN
jgi:hypothetical protein